MPRLPDHRAKIELLRAAEEEFAEHGLTAAKVERITARAGVSKGAFYLHFESKEECFRSIIESFLARFATCIDRAVAFTKSLPASHGDLLEQVLQYDVAIFEVCWQSRALLRMLLEGGGGTPHAYLVQEFRERSRAQSREWIQNAIDAGLYRGDIDPVVVSALVAGAYEAVVHELIRLEKKPDLEAWSRQLFDVFTSGLLARPLPRGQEDAPGSPPPSSEVRRARGPAASPIFDPKVNQKKREKRR